MLRDQQEQSMSKDSTKPTLHFGGGIISPTLRVHLGKTTTKPAKQ
jgi:hypothetical protein